MATLHVRNVPDELYELLRERAAGNDRSIGAETVQLLHERLALTGYGRALQSVPSPGRRRGGGSGPFARFTPEARAVVVEAQERARALGHDHIGTEHMLLAVLARPNTFLGECLGELGLTLERVEQELERSPGGRGDAEPHGKIPFQPAAKQALELALREALKLHDGAIAPSHVLLGIQGQETGRGAEILRAVEPDSSRLRACILSARGRSGAFSMRDAPNPSFRVVLLDGDAEAWEEQLNAAAALGYDLLEIVDRRAILRRV
jgi:ATP-dependent Clp protease ATP-binding subunit ClpA